jgi:hypothetical protein
MDAANGSLDEIRRTFGGALGFVGWVFGLLAPFLLPPPRLHADEGAGWVSAARLLAAIVVLLLLAWLSRGLATRRAALLSLALLAAASASSLGYLDLRDRWTTDIAQERIIMGATYTPFAADYADKLARENGPPPTPAVVLWHSGSDFDAVWPADERRTRSLWLGVLYVVATTLFATLIVAVSRLAQPSAPPRPAR